MPSRNDQCQPTQRLGHRLAGLLVGEPARRRRGFTVDDANRMLPLVRRIAADAARECQTARTLHDALNHTAVEPDRHRLRDELSRSATKLEALSDEMRRLGPELIDYRSGNVEFVGPEPAARFNWKLGDEAVSAVSPAGC